MGWVFGSGHRVVQAEGSSPGGDIYQFLLILKVCSFRSCAFLALCSSEHTCARESTYLTKQ